MARDVLIQIISYLSKNKKRKITHIFAFYSKFKIITISQRETLSEISAIFFQYLKRSQLKKKKKKKKKKPLITQHVNERPA